MKIRMGYVTNSSSSSFIIATNQELPEILKDYLAKIEKQDLLRKIYEEFSYNDVDDNIVLKELGAFTDEQMLLIALACRDTYLLNNYIRAKEAIDEGKQVYIGCIPDYIGNSFIRQQEVIREDYN